MIIRAFKIGTKSVLAFLLVLSVVLNIATVTISGVYSVVSGAASVIGLSTVAARAAKEKIADRKAAAERAVADRKASAERKAADRAAADRKKKTKKVVQDTSKRVSSRMARGAARNSAAALGEAIPFVGVAVIAGGLAIEVKDACETAKDMKGLEAAIDADGDPVSAQKKAMAEFNCTDLIPNANDLPKRQDIWAGMLAAPGKAWKKASAVIADLPERDLSGRAERLLVYWGNKLDAILNWLFPEETQP